MHTSVIQSPQAMSNDQSYRPRSPDLTASADSQQEQQQQHPRLTRLPSYQIQEPTLPKGYSFSPRGSYDASPFFSQGTSQQVANPHFSAQQANSYLEQSPPRFTPAYLPEQTQVFSPVSYQEPSRRSHITDSFSKPLFGFSPLQQQPTADDMARLRSRKPVNYNEDHNGAHLEEPPQVYSPSQTMQQMPQQPQQLMQNPAPLQFMQPMMQNMPATVPMPMPMPMQMQMSQQPTTPPMPHIDVKTKFPVARIKRIMQADEDVGKVAQATPTAVSKALELFMIALVTKGAAEAKKNNTKRVTATHLKQALLQDPQFDFLNEICESVPDEGAKSSKGRSKSEAKSEDSDEEMAGVPKKKKAGRKKKGADDEGSD